MQLDAEASFVSQDDVLAFISEAVADATEAGHAASDPASSPRMTWLEAHERFGTDKPDVRFGMELVELTPVFAATEFKAFQPGRRGPRGFAVKGIRRARRRGLPPATARRADRAGQAVGCQGPGVDEGRRGAARSTHRSPSS